VTGAPPEPVGTYTRARRTRGPEPEVRGPPDGDLDASVHTSFETCTPNGRAARSSDVVLVVEGGGTVLGGAVVCAVDDVDVASVRSTVDELDAQAVSPTTPRRTTASGRHGHPHRCIRSR
jgi:hypothetical protein